MRIIYQKRKTHDLESKPTYESTFLKRVKKFVLPNSKNASSTLLTHNKSKTTQYRKQKVL